MRRKLRTHAKAAIEAGRAQAVKEAEKIAMIAKTLAPQDDGDLIDSIRVEEADTLTTRNGSHPFIGAVVRAGNETTIVTTKQGRRFQNAKLQEGGTQDMPASPFMNPAKRLRRRAARQAIARAIAKAWRAGG
ncbi:hypothetical protein [Ketogulonicigenium vulgare]|uniref:hypothetical protein n=1 Tax=Ketogulonicigenium vulgare TaxID=92945 RepID=UPI002358D23B|nr:hypothetical protein [Ketogulonicigenium vulgare]